MEPTFIFGVNPTTEPPQGTRTLGVGCEGNVDIAGVNGVINTLSVHLGADADPVEICLYSGAGRTGLAKIAAVTTPAGSAAGWHHLPLATSINVSSGTTYAFAVRTTTGSRIISQRTSGSTRAAGGPTSFTDPLSFGTTAYTGPLNIYAGFLLPPPTVTTAAATSITDTTATLNGEITDVGGENATTRGFYLKAGTTGDPTSSDTVIDEDGDFSAETFSLPAAWLSPNTSYRVAAFATNGGGTTVGSTVGFTTGYYVKVPIGITPAGGTLISSHPSGAHHNGAESGVLNLVTNAALIAQDALIPGGYYYTPEGVPVAVGHGDRNYDVFDDGVSAHLTFSNAEENKWRTLLAYSTERTTAELDAVYTFIQRP